ncbi:acyltransferase family protein [Pediococcus acidilactici]|uniref:acyltransferase family protein n=1 Tax=Pediococcus acidilactici TaxID=1254 RepID=UPI001CCDA12F|nr:acyltransferase family protein [Pediococcus acidilactici]
MKEFDEVSLEYKNTGARRYITGFDGLRVLALLGVIFYHLMPYKVPGGYLGVPIFFAVSGYLITDIFIQEWDRTGKIKLGAFYLRRLRRLYPTLVVVLVASTAYMTIFAHNLLSHIRSIILTNLTFVYNWWLVGHGQSYFDRYNGESPFTHLWYLSVLGQYYFIWPLLLIVLLKIYTHRRVQVAGILFSLSVISAMIMAILYHPDTVNRVYYGTDTRVAPFLIGAALAFIWPSTRLKKNLDLHKNAVANIIGLIIMALMITSFFTMPGTSAWPYYGGIFIFSVLSVLMIAIIAHPAFIWNRALTSPVFKWLGSRSYGIYMYQLPVMVFYEQKVTNIAAHPVLNTIAPLVIILVLSELSYRFVEIPLAQFDYRHLGRFLKEMFDIESGFKWRHVGVAAVLFVTFVAIFGAVTVPEKVSQKTDDLQAKLAKNSKATDRKNAVALKKQKEAQKDHAKSKDKHVKLTKKEKAIAQKYHLTDQEMGAAKSIPLTGVGDSVLEDTGADLQEIFPTAFMSAKVGRQVDEAPGLLTSMKKQGQLSDNVLINLGANGPVNAKQIDAIEKVVGKHRKLFWVNVHVPTQTWEGSVNQTLNKATKKYDNLQIIDWNGPAKNQPGWFYGDHVHPNPEGSKEYASLVAKAIIKAVQ